MGMQMPWHACKSQRTTCGMWVTHCTQAVLECRGAGEPGLGKLRVLHVNHQRDLKRTDCLLKWQGGGGGEKRSNEEMLQWEQGLSKPISQISRLLVTWFLRSQFSWEKRSLINFIMVWLRSLWSWVGSVWKEAVPLLLCSLKDRLSLIWLGNPQWESIFSFRYVSPA